MQDKDPQDFKQAGEHYRSMSPADRDHLVHNLVVNLKMVKNQQVAMKLLGNLYRADEGLARKIADQLGVNFEQVKAMAPAMQAAQR